MNHFVPPSSFTTGIMDVEEQSFTWTIENFPVIRSSKSMIDAQKIDFAAGSKVGHPSKWSVFLRESTVDEKKWVGIFFKIEELSTFDPSWKNVFAEMEFAMKWEGGISPTRLNLGPKEVASLTNGRGFPQFISAESTLPRLVIKHTFKLYAPSKSTEACPPIIMEEFQGKFTPQAKTDLLKDSDPGKNIKIISSDKKKFFVQKDILEAKSPAFIAMMKNDKLDANTGVIKFPDISSKGLDVLIPYFYTGAFHPDWSDTKTLVELTHAAANYQLQDLLKLLNLTLGKVCKIENVLALIKPARQYSLKKAKAEMLKFIHEKGNSSRASHSKMLWGEIPSAGNASEGFLPKENFRLWWHFTRPVQLLFPRYAKNKMMRKYEMDRRMQMGDNVFYLMNELKILKYFDSCLL